MSANLTQQIMIRLSSDQLARLDAAAARQRLARGTTARNLILDGLDAADALAPQPEGTEP
jgi:hypothetical protein